MSQPKLSIAAARTWIFPTHTARNVISIGRMCFGTITLSAKRLTSGAETTIVTAMSPTQAAEMAAHIVDYLPTEVLGIVRAALECTWRPQIVARRSEVKDGWHRDGRYTIGGRVRAEVWLSGGLPYFRVLDREGREVVYDYHRTVREARAWCERKLAEAEGG